jgi:HNH endonuclease
MAPTDKARSRLRSKYKGETKEERFWGKVNKTQKEDCWEWIGQTIVMGYGQMRFGGTRKYTHRISWEIHYGEIPKNMFVCHKRDNRLCVNPDHLFLGTHQDNMDDMYLKGRENHSRGESNHLSKLTGSDVLSIYERANKGESQLTLAKEFGTTSSNIYYIKTQRTWKHLTTLEVI